MTIEEHDTVDFVAHDPKRDRILLIMIAAGPWADDGERLPDLQAKLNTYLAYEEKQLWDENPELAGKPVGIQLALTDTLGDPELEFLQFAVNRVLAPSGITLSWKLVGAEVEHEIMPVENVNP